MDKVKCPYCGADMRLAKVYTDWDDLEAILAFYECDECGAQSPETKPDLAHAAAMQRWQEPLPKMWTATPASDRFRCPSDNK